MNKTYLAKKEDVKKQWYLVDAKDKILGRLAAKVAAVLRGKHKAIFTTNIDNYANNRRYKGYKIKKNHDNI